MRNEPEMNCYTLIAGKGISKSGRVLVAHNEDDSGHVVVRRTHVPAQDHAPGELIPAENGLARIPQIPHTLGYYWVEYLTDDGGLTSADSFLNDCGVLIVSNSMGYSREDPNDSSLVKDGGLGYVLRRVLAERSHSAREGAQILMDLVDEWGYAPSGRAYTIADKDEAFMFQLVRGKHYAGGRIPDCSVAVMPNHYTIHTLHDVPEMFYSPDLIDYAVSKGWYRPKDSLRSDFDFAAAYQDERNTRSAANTFRQKHGQRMLLGRDLSPEEEPYPFVIDPGRKVGVDDFRAVMMAHYEGTEDDSERFGPGLSPHMFLDSRRICTGTTLECLICDFAEKPENTCIFTSLGRPCQVPLIPLHPLKGLPAVLCGGFSPSGAMAEHLLPHPGIAAASDTPVFRFRQICSAAEMLFEDTAASRRDLLDHLFEQAKARNLQHTTANDEQADEDYLLSSLNAMEEYARKAFRLVPVSTDSQIFISGRDASVSISFEADFVPVEKTLTLCREYAYSRDLLSTPVDGTLKPVGANIYSVAFPAAPLAMHLTHPGKYIFWLGGRATDNRAFAGYALISVETGSRS